MHLIFLKVVLEMVKYYILEMRYQRIQAMEHYMQLNVSFNAIISIKKPCGLINSSVNLHWK